MSNRVQHSVGIVMNGVTGRMGLNQHLRRSVYAIMQQGGVKLDDRESIMPHPLLVGRNPAKLEAIASECGGLPWSTDLDAALADPAYSIYFDAQTTARRAPAVRQAIAHRKHVYCEKPVADSLAAALELHRLAHAAHVKHGVVQDKLWLPGLLKLKYLIDTGFFGKIPDRCQFRTPGPHYSKKPSARKACLRFAQHPLNRGSRRGGQRPRRSR